MSDASEQAQAISTKENTRGKLFLIACSGNPWITVGLLRSFMAARSLEASRILSKHPFVRRHESDARALFFRGMCTQHDP